MSLSRVVDSAHHLRLVAEAAGDSAAQNLDAFAQWAVSLMELLGAPGIALVIALENLFPPLPSEVVLPLAGFTVSQGSFGLVEVIIWATVGSVLGALALYGVGVWLGRDRVHRLLVKVPLVSVEDVNRTEAWFERHGRKTVFFGRMIPIFRSLISIPAGVTRMSLWQFLLLTAVGSVIWNTVFIYAGFLLGENWSVVEEYAGLVQNAVIAVVLLAVIVFVWRRVLVVRRRRAGELNELGEKNNLGEKNESGEHDHD